MLSWGGRIRTLDHGTKTGHAYVCSVMNRAVEPRPVPPGAVRARQIAPTDAPSAKSVLEANRCASRRRRNLHHGTPGLATSSILSHRRRRFCHIDSVEVVIGTSSTSPARFGNRFTIASRRRGACIFPAEILPSSRLRVFHIPDCPTERVMISRLWTTSIASSTASCATCWRPPARS